MSTVIAQSERASARLVSMTRAVDPSAVIWVLSVDGTACDADRMVRPDELPIDSRELARRIARTSPHDAAAALLPELARLALVNHNHVLILDPAVEVAGPLDDLALRGDEAMRLVPRVLAPLPVDDRHPSLAETHAEGVHLPTILSVAPAASTALSWWSEETARHPELRGPLLSMVASWLTTTMCMSPSHGINPSRTDLGSIHTIDTTGHDHSTPYLMGNRSGERIRLIEHPRLAELFEARAADLADDPKPRRADRAAANRRLYAEALRRHELLGEPEPPVAPSKEFDAWIASPWERPDGLSRAAMALNRERLDLKAAFPAPDLGPVNRREFTTWLRSHGVEQEGIDPAWVPEVPITPPTPTIPGVDLAGYINADLGVGEVARLLELALRRSSIHTSIQTIGGSASHTRFEPRPDDSPSHPIEILCINADRVAEVCKSRGRDPGSVHSIGVFFWETDAITPAMEQGIAAVDEIWAGSNYVSQILGNFTEKPISVVPLPVVTEEPEGDGREAMGVDRSRPVVLFTFDFHSVAKRKNPLGVVDAFRRAFAPDEGPVLVLKSINGDRVPDQFDRLRWVTRDRPDIRVIDGYRPAGVLAAMMRDAEVYASLHRSEGFGLTIAHAMALSTPVLCTEGSGPADFVDERSATIVPGQMVKVGDGADPYPANGRWWEPDIDAAAAGLRKLISDPEFARQQASNAKASITTRDVAATAAFLRNHLSGRPTTDPMVGPKRLTRRWRR